MGSGLLLQLQLKQLLDAVYGLLHHVDASLHSLWSSFQSCFHSWSILVRRQVPEVARKTPSILAFLTNGSLRWNP